MGNSYPGGNVQIPFVFMLNKCYIRPKETRNESLTKRHLHINNENMLLDIYSIWSLLMEDFNICIIRINLCQNLILLSSMLCYFHIWSTLKCILTKPCQGGHVIKHGFMLRCFHTWLMLMLANKWSEAGYQCVAINMFH